MTYDKKRDSLGRYNESVKLDIDNRLTNSQIRLVRRRDQIRFDFRFCRTAESLRENKERLRQVERELGL